MVSENSSPSLIYFVKIRTLVSNATALPIPKLGFRVSVAATIATTSTATTITTIVVDAFTKLLRENIQTFIRTLYQAGHDDIYVLLPLVLLLLLPPSHYMWDISFGHRFFHF